MLTRKVPTSSFCKTNNQLLASNYSCLESKIGEDRSQMPHMIFKYFEDNLILFQEVPTNANDSSGVVTSKITTSSTASNNMTTYNGFSASITQRTPTNNGSFSQSSDSGRPSSEQKTLPIEDAEKVLREGLKSMEALLDKKLNMFSNNQSNSYQLEETKKKLAAEEEKTKKLTIEKDTLKQNMTKVEEESERKTQEIGRKNQEIEELKNQMVKLQSLLQQKENSQHLLHLGVVSNSKIDQVVDKARRGLSEIQDKITNIVLNFACSNEMEDTQGILFEIFYKISLCHAFYCEFNNIDNILMTAYRKLKTLMDESKINLKQGWESILPDFKSVIEAMFDIINQIPDNLNIKLDFSNDPKNKVVQEISQGNGQSSTIEYCCLFPSLSHGESLIEKGSILKFVKFQ